MGMERAYSEPLIYHRDITAADRPLDTNGAPQTWDAANAVRSLTFLNLVGKIPGDRLNQILHPNGARLLEFRFWSLPTDADGDTFQATLVGWPSGVSIPDESGGTIRRPKGCRLWTGTLAQGTQSTVNENPITGRIVAATTFFEADTVSSVTEFIPTTYAAEDGAGANGQSRVYIDPIGFETVFMFIHDLHTDVDRVLVSARRIG